MTLCATDGSLQWLHERFSGERIIYIAGNHDYYCWPGGPRTTFEAENDRGRELADKFGIDLLLGDTVDIDGIMVAGCTLWTDFRLLPGAMTLAAAEAEAVARMRDYQLIFRGDVSPDEVLRPQDTIAMHARDRAWLE